uniref:Uncharacterized protein n=1 Tax=Anguilla anguilla TaxID=7936 RepID=A0A0E9X2X9_ANGAN
MYVSCQWKGDSEHTKTITPFYFLAFDLRQHLRTQKQHDLKMIKVTSTTVASSAARTSRQWY